MRVRHRFTNLEQDADGACARPAFLFALHEFEDLLEIPPRDESHREVHVALGIQSEFVNRNDARVVELPGDLCFFDEARQHARIGLAVRARNVLRENDLHREIAPQIRVPHSEHGAHPAASDFALHQVARRARAPVRKPVDHLFDHVGFTRQSFGACPISRCGTSQRTSDAQLIQDLPDFVPGCLECAKLVFKFRRFAPQRVEIDRFTRGAPSDEASE